MKVKFSVNLLKFDQTINGKTYSYRSSGEGFFFVLFLIGIVCRFLNIISVGIPVIALLTIGGCVVWNTITFLNYRNKIKKESATINANKASVQDNKPSPYDKLCQLVKGGHTFHIPFLDVPEGMKSFNPTAYAKMIMTLDDGRKTMVVLQSTELLDKLCNEINQSRNKWTCGEFDFADIATMIFLNNGYSGIYLCSEEGYAIIDLDDMAKICEDTSINNKVIRLDECSLVESYLSKHGVKDEKVVATVNSFISYKEVFKELVYFIKNGTFKENEINVYGYSASKLAGKPYKFSDFMPFQVLVTLLEQGETGDMLKYLKSEEVAHDEIVKLVKADLEKYKNN